MKLATVFTILSVTILAIAKAENGTRQLVKKKKKKNKFMTKAVDMRLQTSALTSLLKHGPIELFVECHPALLVFYAKVRNDSSDTMGVFGEVSGGGISFSIDAFDDETYIFAVLANFVGVGNLNGVAAIGTSTGFYLSLDGETAIGLIDLSGTGLAEYGEDIGCVFMGVFTMFKKKAPKVVLAGIAP
jgi:hypothetical protein